MLLIEVALVTNQKYAALAVYIIAKDVLPPYITNKMECYSFKSGCVIQMALVTKYAANYT